MFLSFNKLLLCLRLRKSSFLFKILVAGVLGIVTAIATIGETCTQGQGGASEGCCKFINFILGIISMIWFIMGNVWTFGILYPDYEIDCSQLAFTTALVYIIIVYAFIGIAIAFGCCCGCVGLCCGVCFICARVAAKMEAEEAANRHKVEPA